MNDQKEKRIYGGLQSLPPDDRDFALGAFYELPPLSELPSEYFLMPKRILDQKDSDLCTAFASVAASMDQEGVELSPEFTFAMTKKIEGDWHEWGANLRDAAKSHVKIGALPKELSPFSLATHPRDFIANWDNWPFELQEKAAAYRKQAYFSVEGPYDLFDNIRASLWKFRLELRSIWTGALWRLEWTRAVDGIIPNEELPKEGFGHAFKLCGWKQIIVRGNLDSPSGDPVVYEPYLIAQLSNGEDTGDKGFYYFPREVVNREFTFGNYMFQDLPPSETKETSIEKSREFRTKKNEAFLAWLTSIVKKWFQKIVR